MNHFILVHPNNKLTRLDDLSIPSVKRYKEEIELQIKEINKSQNLNSERIKRLIDFKNAEFNYVNCYLIILTNLEAICKTCQVDEIYDYEKEDEILNKIEDKMKELKNLENTLSLKKTFFETDGSSCKKNEEISEIQKIPSLINLENKLFENLQI